MQMFLNPIQVSLVRGKLEERLRENLLDDKYLLEEGWMLTSRRVNVIQFELEVD